MSESSSAIQQIHRRLYEARVGDVITLFVRPAPGESSRKLAGEVYEILDRDGDTREIRMYEIDGYPNEIVARVEPTTNPTSSTPKSRRYRIPALDYYEDRIVQIEYGPDGARTGIYIEDVTEVRVRER